MRTLFFALCAVSWVLAQVDLQGDVVYTSTNVSSPGSSFYPRIVMKAASAGASAPEVVLFQSTCWNANPRFSWDKNTVVFASGLDYSPPTSPTLTLLYTIPTSSSAPPQRVTTLSKDEYNEFAADWSADSKQVVIEYTWHSTKAGASESNTRLGTVQMNDNTSFAPLMENTKESYNDYCARWNPQDSNYILFVSDRTGSAEIFLYDFQKNSASLIRLPHELGATANCPFWDHNGHSFHYEVDREGEPPFMAVVDFNAPVLVPKPQFRIKYVNTPSASGVAEYIQCTSGPSSSAYFSCLRSGPDGDTIVIIDNNGELVQNVTTTAPTLYHMTPDWK